MDLLRVGYLKTAIEFEVQRSFYRLPEYVT